MEGPPGVGTSDDCTNRPCHCKYVYPGMFEGGFLGYGEQALVAGRGGKIGGSTRQHT